MRSGTEAALSNAAASTCSASSLLALVFGREDFSHLPIRLVDSYFAKQFTIRAVEDHRSRSRRNLWVRFLVALPATLCPSPGREQSLDDIGDLLHALARHDYKR